MKKCNLHFFSQRAYRPLELPLGRRPNDAGNTPPPGQRGALPKFFLIFSVDRLKGGLG